MGEAPGDGAVEGGRAAVVPAAVDAVRHLYPRPAPGDACVCVEVEGMGV